MSLLDKLADRAMDEAAERGPDWLAKGLDAADELAAETFDGEALGHVRKGLQVMKDNEAELVSLGVGGLGRFVALIGAGRDAQAKEALLAALENASFADLMRASDSAAEAVIRDAEARDAAWESVKQLGADLAQKVLPLLLMAL